MVISVFSVARFNINVLRLFTDSKLSEKRGGQVRGLNQLLSVNKQKV